MRILKKQQGIGLGYLMFFIATATLVSTFAMRNSDMLSTSALDAQYLASAHDLMRSSQEMAAKVSQLRLGFGGLTDFRIADGNIVSASNASATISAPNIPASAALSAWSLSENNRLNTPVSGEVLRVATIDVTQPVCTAFNRLNIRHEQPSLNSSTNGFGGLTYSISNAGFNNGQVSTLFCVQGAGVSDSSRIFLGLSY